MTAVVDTLASATGWSASGGAAVLPVNTYPDFCAGDQASSLLFSFAAGVTPGAQYVQKTVTFDASLYDEMVFSVASLRGNLRSPVARFDEMDDFLYQIDFGDGRAYLIPTWRSFSQVTIPVAAFGTTAVTRIRITYLGDTADYLVVSWMIASKQDLPGDILSGVKDGLDAVATELFGLGIPVGKCTATAGDIQITLTGSYAMVQRYAVFYIYDPANGSEKHQLFEVNGPVGQLHSTFDGSAMLYDHTAAQVYLVITNQVGRTEQDPPLPGVVITSAGTNPVHLTHGFDMFLRCWGPTGPALQQEGRKQRFIVLLYAVGVQEGGKAYAASVIRRWLSRFKVWVAGHRLDFVWTESSQPFEPGEAVELLPGEMYTVEVEVREDVWVMPTPPAVAGPSGQVVNVLVEETTLP